MKGTTIALLLSILAALIIIIAFQAHFKKQQAKTAANLPPVLTPNPALPAATPVSGNGTAFDNPASFYTPPSAVGSYDTTTVFSNGVGGFFRVSPGGQPYATDALGNPLVITMSGQTVGAVISGSQAATSANVTSGALVTPVTGSNGTTVYVRNAASMGSTTPVQQSTVKLTV